MYTENFVSVFIFISVFLAPLSILREYGRRSVPDPCGEEFPTSVFENYRPVWEGRGLTASAPIPEFLDSWIPGPDPNPRRAEKLYL